MQKSLAVAKTTPGKIMADGSDEKFFCFIHIPKAGGATFHQILLRNLGTEYLYIPDVFSEGPLPEEKIKWALNNGTHLKAIGGHRISARLPFDETPFNLVAIAFLRNPVQRFISEYHYVKKLGTHPEINKSDSLESFVSEITENPEKHSWYWNTQFKMFQVPMDRISRLVEQGKLHLFPLERFDEALIFLKKRYPGTFLEVSYRQENRNSVKNPPPQQETLDAINRFVSEDKKLHHLAHAHLTNVLKTRFPEGISPQEYRNLQFRCRLRRMFLDDCVTFLEKILRVCHRLRV